MTAQRVTSKVPTKGTHSLVIVVAPASRSTGQFEAYLNDRQLCVSRTPFYEAARVLMAEGVDPRTTLVMRHAGSQTDSLKASLAAAAGSTVEETIYGPKLRRWKPLSALDGSLRIAPTAPGGSRSRAKDSDALHRVKVVGEIGEQNDQKLNTEPRG